MAVLLTTLILRRYIRLPRGMKLPKLPRVDLFPGTDQDPVILLITGLALLYVGTGGWTEQRWREALAAAAPPISILLGYRVGYNTLNPKLHVEEIMGLRADSIAGRVVRGVVSGAAEAVTDHAAAAVRGKLSDGEVEAKVRAQFMQPPVPDPREAAPAAPVVELPDGWRIDDRGRFRDTSGRVASDKRRLRALRKSVS